MKTETLVILAAGLGSRYGGTKQLEHLTPEGETIIDFSLYDALVAGIRKVVFVVRSEILADLKNEFGPKLEGRAEVDYVCQDEAALPAPSAARKKPWGTGHAILAAGEAVDEDFWVVNADDFYGRSSFLRMANAPAGGSSMVGFRLGATLSANGPVSRGQCVTDEDGFLQAVIERKRILRENGRITCDEPAAGAPPLTEDTTVSMNFWGFTPQVFGLLERRFAEFLELSSGDPAAEFFITEAVTSAIRDGETSVRVLKTDEQWVGVTYREDADLAAAHLESLRARGVYPPSLW